MHTVLNLAQLRWTGHVIRMPDKRLSNKVFYGEQQQGKRSQGGQKKRIKDTFRFRHTSGVLGAYCIGAISGEVSFTKEQLSMNKRESVKLKESAEKAKPISMGLQLIQ